MAVVRSGRAPVKALAINVTEVFYMETLQMEAAQVDAMHQAQPGPLAAGPEVVIGDELFLLVDTEQRGAPELSNVQGAVPFGVDLMLRATVATEPDFRRITATNRTSYTVATTTRTSRQTVNRATGGTDAAPDTQPDQDIKYDQADALADLDVEELQL